jgi:hypothetical protein
MPTLSKDYLKFRLDDISKQMPQKEMEYNKFLFCEGATSDLLKKTILREFKKPESVEGLFDRILPLNIMKKIINKLAATYIEPPLRLASDGNPDDQDLITLYEDSMSLDTQMLQADRYYENYKKTILEPYVDKLGSPRIRCLPAHSYFAFSEDPISPEIPDAIFKVIKIDPRDKEKCFFSVWTNEQFLIIDGQGKVQNQAMAALNNEGGVNPYGVIPFGYMVESSTSIEPIQDDDLYKTSLAVPVLLTDLSFGCKFMAYSLIWTVDCNADIPAGAGAILHLSSDPSTGKSPAVNQLKPDINVDATLRLIESIISYLLSTRGLKTSTVIGKLDANDAASGISKIIDNSELAFSTKSKVTGFVNLEKQIWNMIAKNLQPVWKKQNKLSPKFTQDFSEPFDITIHFSEPKIVMSEKDKIDMAKAKLDAGFTTLRRTLMDLYPTYSEDQVQELMQEIKEEKQSNYESFFNKQVAGNENGVQEPSKIQD